MKNEIDKIRSDAKLFFEPNNIVGEENEQYSKSGNYYFTMTHHRQSDEKRNWVTSKVEIYKTGSANCDFEFLANSEDVIFHSCWVTKNDIEYLLLPEAMGGQSVYDTKNKKFFSFYNEEEPFIWLDAYVAPDANKIAVEGCYWACPSELRIYDSSDITDLPFKLIHRDVNVGSQLAVHWENNTTLKICRNENEFSTIDLNNDPNLD